MSSALLLAAAIVSLTGTEWSSVNAPSQTLKFDNGVLSSFAGCNSGSGNYRQNDEALELNIVAMTQMACLDDGLMAEERKWLDTLPRVHQFQIENGNLLLQDLGGSTLIKMKAK